MGRQLGSTGRGFFAAIWMAGAAPALPAEDVQIEARLRQEVERIRALAADPAVVEAVQAQNAKQVPLSQIRSLDLNWQIERERNARMQALLGHACSRRLREFQQQSSELYRESFAMDDQGALVCMTQPTSDYWQGDEDKWQKAFAEGRGAVFVDQPLYDQSTAGTLVQISVPVTANGRTVGVLTVGLDDARLHSGVSTR